MDDQRRDTALVVVSGLAIVFLIAQLLDFGFGRDQGIYAVVGRAILDGGVPYRDAWDFKPPGIFFLYASASAVFGEGTRAIRLLEASCLVAVVPAFVILSRHYVGDWRPGVLSSALAALVHVQLEFWHTAQPESFGVLFIGWGFAFATLAEDAEAARTSAAFWMMSGLCAGVSLLLKPTIAVGLAAPVGFGLWRHRRTARNERDLSASLVGLSFGLGALLAVAGCVAFFVGRGGFSDLQRTFAEFVPNYTGLAWQRAQPLVLLFELVRRWLFAFAIVNAVGLALFLVPFPSGRAREGLLCVGTGICLLLLGVYSQARLYPYHYGSVLALTALLAGWGYWRLWLGLRTTRRGALVFASFVAVLLIWRPSSTDLPDSFVRRCELRIQSWVDTANRDAIRDRLYTVADYRARDNRMTAAWVTQHTEDGRGIFVYGFTPEIYVASNRHLASRYIYDVPLRATWSRDTARMELMRSLDDAAPSAIVVEHGDRVGDVTGLPSDSASDLTTFTELRSLIERRYERQPPIGKFEIFRRVD